MRRHHKLGGGWLDIMLTLVGPRNVKNECSATPSHEPPFKIQRHKHWLATIASKNPSRERTNSRPNRSPAAHASEDHDLLKHGRQQNNECFGLCHQQEEYVNIRVRKLLNPLIKSNSALDFTTLIPCSVIWTCKRAD